MDFFQAQDRARQRTSVLVLYFIAAVVSIIAVLYGVALIVFRQTLVGESGPESFSPPFTFWDPGIFISVAAGTIAIVGIGSLVKMLTLRSGGGTVARSLGGRLVSPDTTDLRERRLFNVVEEMAIASGVRVPEIYILSEEGGINAFAAGWTPDNAAVAVTRGALDTLTRDELQGVIAHEFSHILNGDMRLNIRLIGLLFGILLLTVIGRGMMRAMGGARSSSGKGKGGHAGIVILGLVLVVVGYIGVLFGRLIQAAVSRQREYLADAAAVQFTRNPAGIAGALKKIGGMATGSRVANAHATESCHLFFANALASAASGPWATHPPLVERIRLIEPSFDGRFPSVTQHSDAHDTATTAATSSRTARRTPLSPEQFVTALAVGVAATSSRAHDLLDAIPPDLRDAAHSPERAPALLHGLLAHAPDEATAARERHVLQQALGPGGMSVALEYARDSAPLPDEARLALVDLALPTLRQLPQSNLAALLTAQDQLIAADYRTSPFEFALAHIVRRALGPLAGPANVQPKLPNFPHAPAPDVAALLDAIARAGSDNPVHVAHAYAAGAKNFGLSGDLASAPREPTRSLNALALPLQRLERTSMTERARVLTALAHAAAADGDVRAEEQALLRAFAAALDCPAPLLDTGRGSD